MIPDYFFIFWEVLNIETLATMIRVRVTVTAIQLLYMRHYYFWCRVEIWGILLNPNIMLYLSHYIITIVSLTLSYYSPCLNTCEPQIFQENELIWQILISDYFFIFWEVLSIETLATMIRVRVTVTAIQLLYMRHYYFWCRVEIWDILLNPNIILYLSHYMITIVSLTLSYYSPCLNTCEPQIFQKMNWFGKCWFLIIF